MSSDSSYASNEFLDDRDETCSCGTYSSGWDRSSTTSDYFESDTEDDVADIFPSGKGFYQQPKKTGKPTLFDTEYKCELVLLPNPYKKNRLEDDGQKMENKNNNQAMEDPKEDPKPVNIANPWNKLDTSGKEPEDPWKFLEDMKKKHHMERPHREPRREEKRRPTNNRPIDNSNTNKLCKYKNECRMNKNNNCSMIHTLSAWKPRICRFNTNCKRKTVCGYYHTDMSLTDYLKTMMKLPDTIYAKNSSLYEKYL